jgi:hypothetical protein
MFWLFWFRAFLKSIPSVVVTREINDDIGLIIFQTKDF